MFRVVFSLLAVAFSLGLGACSNYRKRWTAAAQVAPGRKTVEGSYAGTWRSDQGGFGGNLWCIVEPVAGKDQVYRAQFRATWHRVFVSEHEILLHGRPVRGGGVKFKERAEIKMWVGSGSYDAEGTIRAGNFRARYDAHYDRGAFEMTRAEKR